MWIRCVQHALNSQQGNDAGFIDCDWSLKPARVGYLSSLPQCLTTFTRSSSCLLLCIRPCVPLTVGPVIGQILHHDRGVHCCSGRPSPPSVNIFEFLPRTCSRTNVAHQLTSQTHTDNIAHATTLNVVDLPQISPVAMIPNQPPCLESTANQRSRASIYGTADSTSFRTRKYGFVFGITWTSSRRIMISKLLHISVRKTMVTLGRVLTCWKGPVRNMLEGR